MVEKSKGINSLHDAAETVNETTEKAVSFAKNRLFDVVAVFIIIAMAALTLGVLEKRDLTLDEIINITLECIPFYLAAMLLTTNYYTKGKFVGKSTALYIEPITTFSNIVNDLTGDMLNYLPDFCVKYNEDELKRLRTVILRSVGISFERFDEELTKDGEILQPLKVLTKPELLKLYNKDIVKVIIKCKKLKVKGISVNMLLGNTQVNDNTNLGPDEAQITKRRTAWYASGYIVAIVVMAIISVKNILEWGWASVFFMIFKLLYIVCRAYMRYFDGYNDITIRIATRINRKTDILKQFKEWYFEQFPDEKID